MVLVRVYAGTISTTPTEHFKSVYAVHADTTRVLLRGQRKRRASALGPTPVSCANYLGV